MAKFYAPLPAEGIVATLSQQVSWSHFVELIKLDDAVKREFYIQLCADGRWSVRTLRQRMGWLSLSKPTRMTTIAVA